MALVAGGQRWHVLSSSAEATLGAGGSARTLHQVQRQRPQLVCPSSRHVATAASLEPAPHHSEPSAAAAVAPAAPVTSSSTTGGALSSSTGSTVSTSHSKQLPKSPQRRAVAAAVAAEPLAPLLNFPSALQHAQRSTSNVHNPLDALTLRSGRVDLIVGPMFAGKTTQLILRAREAEAAGFRVLVVKSIKDNRYDKQNVATHDGDLLPCLAVQDLAHVPDAQLAECDVVAIDEAQFFSDLVPFVHRMADQQHKTVLVAGLDGDFRRARFGQVLDLVPLADSILKLHTRCHHAGCTRPGLFSMRITADTAQEVVGGADKYLPACRLHYRGPAPEAPQPDRQHLQ